jgi:hypothetical protein
MDNINLETHAHVQMHASHSCDLLQVHQHGPEARPHLSMALQLFAKLRCDRLTCTLTSCPGGVFPCYERATLRVLRVCRKGVSLGPQISIPTQLSSLSRRTRKDHEPVTQISSSVPIEPPIIY